MQLINCEPNLILTQTSTCLINNFTGARRFAITGTKLYVPLVTLSPQDNAKLLQQLKSGFQRTINWNKYQSDPKTYAQNQYVNYLVDQSFQVVNRLFALSFENENGRASHSEYYLPEVEIKDYIVKIDGKNVFDQPIKNDIETYEKSRKISTGQEDDYTTYTSLLQRKLQNDCKQQALDADPRTIQQIDFTGNLHRAGNTTTFFIIEEAKETVLDFLHGNTKAF